jgi:hypothetical protein
MSYPDNWHMISYQVKEEAGWKCIRCCHPHDPKNGYTLTVHYVDGNPDYNDHYNLRALCQRCHLRSQPYSKSILAGQMSLCF